MSDSVPITNGTRRTLVNAQGAVAVVYTASERVDEQVSEIRTQTEHQAEEMTAVVEDVSELSATIEEIAASADEVGERSTRAKSQVETAQASAQHASNRMDSVTTVAQDVSRQVGQLIDQVDRIEEVLSGISRIADQTDMLALNASIEAARAGEGSEGFAVVAEEIKTLAAESQDQADEIETLLTGVRDAADDTVEQMDAALDELSAGESDVSAVAESLEEVADVVEATVADVSQVSQATETQAQVSETVTERCETAAERAETIQSRVTDIHSARREQTAMLGEVDEAVSDATPPLSLDSTRHISTGTAALDDCSNGGLLQGGRSVIRYSGTSVADLVARLCGAALTSGYAVSLMPTPDLDRQLLSSTLSQSGIQLTEAMDTDHLFVLDAFDSWRTTDNVFDVSRGLGRINEETARRRSRPLLILGNIAGEIRVLGEEQARAARYENDSGTFEADDTVCNIVNDDQVDTSFAAFYAGAADQVFQVDETDGRRRVELLQSPTGSAQPQPIRTERQQRLSPGGQ